MLRWLAICGFLIWPVAALAQTDLSAQLRSVVVTIDLERIDSETNFGLELQTRFNEELEALARDNDRIVEELNGEEQQLAEDRSTDDPAAFKVKADAFDEKVRRFRSEQDAKLQDLRRRIEDARQELYSQVIAQIAQERGALVVIERRSVYLVADSIDITDQVIARINQNPGEQGE